MSDYYRLDFCINPVNSDAADLLAAFLADIGFDSFEESDKGLTGYIESAKYSEEELKEIISTFPMDCEIKWEKSFIEHKDWNEEWEKKYFKPLILSGGKCVVHSSFHTDYPKSEYEIVIDPKMAFGTGHHATTSMMVEHLFSRSLANKSVIDMGTGTGILAILAKKLGAQKVYGIEIDPVAFENAKENAVLNESEIDLILGDATALQNIPQKVDIFLANINRNIILADLEKYLNHLKDDGRLILSGFYDSDIALIEAALNVNGMEIEDTRTLEGGWSSIVAKMKN